MATGPALFLGSVALYAAVPLLVALRRTSFRFVLFYAHIAATLTIGGLIGGAYVLPVLGDVTLLATQVAYGAFMFATLVTVVVGRDVQIVRNIILLTVLVNALLFGVVRLSRTALRSSDVANPLGLPPELFDQSLPIVLIGGLLIIAELLALLGILELAKRSKLGRLPMGVVYVAAYVAILVLDGVLFPTLALRPSEDLGQIIAHGVRAKLVLAAVYAVPLVAFVALYRRAVDRFEATPLRLTQIVSVSHDRLLDQLDEQQAQLEETSEIAGRTSAVVERILDAASTTLIIVTDPEQRITHFNRGGQDMLGYSEESVLGRTPAEVFHRDAGDMVEGQLARGRRRDREYVTRDGQTKIISLSVTPIHDGDRLIGYLGVGEDVSDRVRAEAAAAEALTREHAAVARLEEADRVKDELVSTISHELRTPITSIQGYGELLADGSLGDLTQEQSDALAKVVRNATRLEVLIDDLLVMAQSERGELALKEEPTDLVDVVRGVADSLEQLASRKQLDLRFDLPHADALVLGDPAALERVVLNLGGNAVKFTPDGGEVVVGVRRRGSSCELSVRDSGIGISTEDQERMFTRFFRAGEANRRHIPGTGLGLSVVHTLVTRHGGEVRVDSEPGHGTTMTVLLPALA